MEMVCLKAGMRIDRFDGFGEALRVIRAGCGDMQTAVVSVLKQLLGICTILRCHFTGHQDPVMLILHHHHTMVRPHRVVAVNMTLRS